MPFFLELIFPDSENKSTDSSLTTSQASPFLQLPGEIRNRIYEICLTDGIGETRGTQTHEEQGHNLRQLDGCLRQYRSLSGTCRQIRQEYLPWERRAYNHTAIINIQDIDKYLAFVSSSSGSAPPDQNIAIYYPRRHRLHHLDRKPLVVDLLPLLRYCHSSRIKRCSFYQQANYYVAPYWNSPNTLGHIFEAESDEMAFLGHLNLLQSVELLQVTIPSSLDLSVRHPLPRASIHMDIHYDVLGVNPFTVAEYPENRLRMCRIDFPDVLIFPKRSISEEIAVSRLLLDVFGECCHCCGTWTEIICTFIGARIVTFFAWEMFDVNKTSPWDFWDCFY